ncbi:energy transducer TonB [Sphingobacterium kitahiroshimense]|uniref:Energy transducer TonB n=1 Tax=Sphingobacterium kitahiroshimense TaxID=470446 RepID=A0ABV0BSX5_9SPHI
MKYSFFNINKCIVYFILLFFAIPTKAQETIVTYMKKNGGYTANKDSADYTNILRLIPNEAGVHELNEYYPNGNLKRHGWVKTTDPKRLYFEGPLDTYYDNGSLESSTTYVNNKLADTVKRYYNNGILKENRIYFNLTEAPNEFLSTDMNSRLIYYADSTGTVQIKDGHGKVELKNGQDVERGSYSGGLRTGYWEGSFIKSKYQFEEWYENGVLTKGTTTDSLGKKHPYEQREIQPEYKGGIPKLMMFIAQNYEFPNEALKAQVNGQVMISFVIDTTGVPVDLKIISDLGYGTGQKGIDVVKKAKEWIPGYRRGIPVRVQYFIPIRLNSHPAPNKS